MLYNRGMSSDELWTHRYEFEELRRALRQIDAKDMWLAIRFNTPEFYSGPMRGKDVLQKEFYLAPPEWLTIRSN